MNRRGDEGNAGGTGARGEERKPGGGELKARPPPSNTVLEKAGDPANLGQVASGLRPYIPICVTLGVPWSRSQFFLSRKQGDDCGSS